MLFSASRRFVFIAVPKTGSSAINNHLVRIDPSIKRNEVLDENGSWQKVHTHITAAEVRRIMGSRADHYTFIAFLRHPQDVLRSKYFFYANGRPAKSFDRRKIGLRDREADGVIDFRTALRVLVARILPLPLWAALYPFKSSAHFIVDKKGKSAVDEIGDFARFDEEAQRIFSHFGYSIDNLDFPKVNVSTYDKNIRSSKFLDKVVNIKTPLDNAMYSAVAANPDLKSAGKTGQQ
jgi:hypothetical protein